MTSTAATTPGAAWSVSQIDAQWTGLTDISCANITFCAAVDSNGYVLSSSSPLDASTWQRHQIATTALTSISCPSLGLCVAGTAGGTLLTSTEPATPGWLSQQLTAGDSFGLGIQEIACPSTSLCLLSTLNGTIYESEDPAAGTASWHVLLAQTQFVRGLSCTSDRFCTVLLNSGAVLLSTDVTAAKPHWETLVTITNGLVGGISCATVHLCAVLNSSADVTSSADPTAGSGAWVTHSLEPLLSTNPLIFTLTTSITCPSSSACLVFDREGNVFVGNATPPPSPSAVAAALIRQMQPNGSAAQLRASGGYRLTFVSPAAGRLSLSWYDGQKLIAHSLTTFRASEPRNIEVTLLKSARRVLKQIRRVELRFVATFTTPTGRATTVRSKTTLRN